MPHLGTWTRLSLMALLFVGLCGCDDSASRSGEDEGDRSEAGPTPSPVASGNRTGQDAPPAMITPGKARPEMPPGHPPIADPHAGVTRVAKAASGPAELGPDNVVKLSGLRMKVPEGWAAQPVKSGPMAPRIAFSLPPAEGDATGCELRISHYPQMKGKDELNIRRWIGQVSKPDGSPYAREDVDVNLIRKDSIRLTVVDLSGAVHEGMGREVMMKPDHRMIAAIVDHPKGPHFVKASGPARSMAKWADAIKQFLETAEVAD
jgi:hypothetical protein